MIIDDNKIDIYAQARIGKDRNYDGQFFFAVKTTGIFCRPSCPSPIAKEENVIYTETMFKAIELGYRPCMRCRPDLELEYNNSYIPGSEAVQHALTLIYDGFLNYHSIENLASEVYLSERQLRKLFIDSIGLPPVKVGRYHKSIFARKMLLSSSDPVTDIAFASGFKSTRQFNSTYHEIFGESPTETRKKYSNKNPSASLLLQYNGNFNFEQILEFMKPRLIKGIELIDGNTYMRTFRTAHTDGWISVSDRSDANALELRINCEDVRCYMEIYYRVRKMFDLDTDFTLINKLFGDDPKLSLGMKNNQVPRLPAALDPFEFVIRAILGQQITVKAATTLAGRIAEAAGKECTEAPEGLSYYFPTPDELAQTNIAGIGITKTRQQTIRNTTEAVSDGSVKLSANQSFDKFHSAFTAVKGIGDWTINYTAMRGLGMKDAFPAADLGIIKAFTRDGQKPSIKEIITIAEKWRPYRSYATLCIWNLPSD